MVVREEKKFWRPPRKYQKIVLHFIRFVSNFGVHDEIKSAVSEGQFHFVSMMSSLGFPDLRSLK